MSYIASTPRIGIVNLTDVALAASLGQPGNSQLPSVTTEPQFGEIATGYDTNLGGGEFMYARVATTVVAAQTISSITISGTTATLTTGSSHGLVVGNVINITGAAPSGYNGLMTVLTVPSGTTLTFTIATNTPTVSATTVGAYVAGIGVGMICELAYTLTSGVLIITATPWAGTVQTGKPLAVAMANILPQQAGWFQVQGAAITVVTGTVTLNAAVYFGAVGTLQTTLVASKQVIGATAASVISSVIGAGNGAVTLPSYQALVFLNRPSVQTQIT